MVLRPSAGGKNFRDAFSVAPEALDWEDCLCEVFEAVCKQWRVHRSDPSVQTKGLTSSD